MENYLIHEIVVPAVWYKNFTGYQIVDEIIDQLTLMSKNNKEYEGSTVSIDGFETKIKILTLELCWWFVRDCDEELNARDYVFTGTAVNNFPNLIIHYAAYHQS